MINGIFGLVRPLINLGATGLGLNMCTYGTIKRDIFYKLPIHRTPSGIRRGKMLLSSTSLL
jgi:hypothetical protein